MLAYPAASEPLIIPPGEAAGYLARTGLETAFVEAALRAGHQAAGNLDAFYPSTSRGYYLWATVNAVLRREHVRINPAWQSINRVNRPLLRNAETGHVFTAAGGDEFTGLADGDPNVRRGMGPATRAALTQSQGQLTIPGLDREIGPPARDGFPPPGEWFILYRETADHLSAEVSFPTGLDEEGFVRGWAVRVLLEDIQLDGEILPLPLFDGGHDVDFRIEEA